MSCPTAHVAASIRIDTPIYRGSPERAARAIERYVCRFTALGLQPEIQFGRGVQIGDTLGVSWLPTTIDRIQRSVLTEEQAKEDDARWLSQDVADAATRFLRDTADLVPGEPFIYRSQGGDLVAEFRTQGNSLTIIISPRFVLLFGVVGDRDPIDLKISDLDQLRDQTEKFIEKLRVQHGTVETGR